MFLFAALLFLFTFPRPNLAACGRESISKVAGTHAPKGSICVGELLFEDNFDIFDLEVWSHENTLGGGGNWEFEWYLNNRSNSFVQDGILYLKPTLLSETNGEDFVYTGTLDINGGYPVDECTNAAFYGCSRTGDGNNIVNPIKSARVRTVDSFSFTYGRVEIRAKIPAGDWLWPAIWMMPRYNGYSTWPSSGEIDIMESRGNRNLRDAGGNLIGTQLVSSTLHWGPGVDSNQYPRTHWESTNPAGYDQDFHVYAVEWTQDGFTFFIDDAQIGSVQPPDGGFWQLGELDSTGRDNPWRAGSKMAPFDQKFYIILNVAVGGIAFFPDDATNDGGKPWTNDSPIAMRQFWEGRDQWLPTWQLETNNAALQVDYVRVYAV